MASKKVEPGEKKKKKKGRYFLYSWLKSEKKF
jgi:hypothetical protein